MSSKCIKENKRIINLIKKKTFLENNINFKREIYVNIFSNLLKFFKNIILFIFTIIIIIYLSGSK